MSIDTISNEMHTLQERAPWEDEVEEFEKATEGEDETVDAMLERLAAEGVPFAQIEEHPAAA
jgi:hypothetical protein